MEGEKNIADEPRPQAKYTGTVYPYIFDSFGSSNSGCPRTDVYPQLELVSLLSTSCAEIIYLYMFRHSVCNSPTHH